MIKSKLKVLASRVQDMAQGEVKIFVDTAPVMEKPIAAKAGLGWQGKHTNLVSRDFGSWLFLGSIFTTAEIEPDAPEEDHCGACRRCLDVCPTNAFVAPYQLDARACISYLTIEHKGHIAPEYREAMGNRIFGCDDCLAVCPWNKFATVAREAKLSVRAESDNPPLCRAAPARRCGVPRALSRHADQTDGPRPIPAQCADRRRQFRGRRASCRRWKGISATPRRWSAPWRCGRLSRLAPDWAAAVRESEAQAEGDPAVADEWARIGA